MLPIAVAASMADGPSESGSGSGWGILTFLVLEQFLHWHHCHRSLDEHGLVGYLGWLPTGCTTSSADSPSVPRSCSTSGSA